MKKIFFILFLGLGALMLMQSCTKSPTETVVQPVPVDDTTWATVDTIPKITDSLDKPVVVDSFNCAISDDNANTINIGDSVTVNFPVGGCMTVNNDPNTIIKKSTKIRAEVRILASKGDLIRFHASTISNSNIIAIGAFINIKLFYKGKEIFWNAAAPPIQVKIKAPNTTQILNYFSFQPSAPNSKDSTWLPNLSSINYGLVVPYKDNQKRNWYQITSNRTRLFGCAYYIDKDNPKPQTRLNVFLPLKYTNENTLVYAVLDKYKSVIRLKPNAQGKSYGTTGIPVNEAVTIVSISKIKGVYHLGIKPVTVADSKPITVLPNDTTKSEVNNFLKNL